MVAEDFAVAIITTPLKFVGIDLNVVAYTEMKVSTICFVLVESVFFGEFKNCVHSARPSTHLRLWWHQLVDIIKDHNRGLVPPRLRNPVCEELS